METGPYDRERAGTASWVVFSWICKGRQGEVKWRARWDECQGLSGEGSGKTFGSEMSGNSGVVAEWFKAAVLKTAKGESPS